MSLVCRCAVCDAPNPAGSHCKGTWCPRESGIRKEHIRKDEFDPSNPMHFRLQSRGGAWRYYRRVDEPRIFPYQRAAMEALQQGKIRIVATQRRTGKMPALGAPYGKGK